MPIILGAISSKATILSLMLNLESTLCSPFLLQFTIEKRDSSATPQISREPKPCFWLCVHRLVSSPNDELPVILNVVKDPSNCASSYSFKYISALFCSCLATSSADFSSFKNACISSIIIASKGSSIFSLVKFPSILLSFSISSFFE